MVDKLLSISEACKLMDVCENTLRDWDIEGKFRAERSSGGHRLATGRALPGRPLPDCGR
jgi:excisionase family DNA binding protein